MTTWMIGPSRVVQKAAMPRFEYMSALTRYAPQIATAKTAASIGSMWNSGRNSSDSTTATGSHRTIMTSFHPAK